MVRGIPQGEVTGVSPARGSGRVDPENAFPSPSALPDDLETAFPRGGLVRDASDTTLLILGIDTL
jgi:hypothetical protein